VVGKIVVLEHKSGNISETREDRGKVTMGPIETHKRSFESNVPSPTFYGLLFPKIGGSQPHPKNPKLQSLLSQEPLKLYGLRIWPEHSQGLFEQKPIKNCRKGSVGESRDCPEFLSTSYYLRNG